MRFFPTLSDAKEAELRACQHALALVRKLKLRRVIFELDSVIVVSKLNMEERDRSMYGPVYEEVKAALRELDDHQVKWARRSANGVAHVLAKEGCRLEISKTWFLMYPDCIENLLNQDVSGN